MKQSDWQEIERILGMVLELPEEQRATQVEQLCAGNSDLRSELLSLLAAHKGASSFLEVKTMVSTDAAATASLVSKQLGPYRLLELIGQGGMGTVYRAERADGQFKKEVAIKVAPTALYSPELLRRFSSEQQILATLEHPNIARLLDAGVSDDGVPYLVMEYVQGSPITDYCRSRRLSVRERSHLFQKVCSTVHYAHQHLIVHRDIKPANILVTGEGVPKLLDFGIAKLLNPGTAAAPNSTISIFNPMTPNYASPEQARGEMLTTASDVYSLGVVLFELLTGEPPYQLSGMPVDKAIRILDESRVEKPTAVVRRQLSQGAPALEFSSDLDAIVAKAMRKEAQGRYASAEEFASDIGRFLEGLPVAAHQGTFRYRAGKLIRRHRLGVGISVAAVVLLLSFAAMMALQARRIAKERDRANREAEASKRVAEFMTNMFKVSDPNETRGNSVTVREILDKASSEIESSLARNPNLQARMLHVMGRSYLSLGLYDRAQSLLQRGLEVSAAVGEQESREALGIRQDLGWTLWQQGHVAEAESLSRQLLQAQQRVLGPDDADTAGTISLLATLVDTQGNHEEGMKLARQALEKQKRILGPEAFDTLATMDNLAVMLAQDGQLNEAEKLEQQTLEIQLRVYGLENLGTINSMLNLANVERDLGREEAAKKLFRQALEVEARVLGPDQPETAQTRYDFACLFARNGQAGEALSLLRQAVDHGLPPRAASGLNTDPCFHALQGDPQFASLVKHIEARAHGASH